MQPLHILEIFLQPGDYYFGDCDTRIRTILGSCVSITFWHPVLKVGGMCHFMLPERTVAAKQDGDNDGRYADEAMALLLKEMKAVGAPHREYQVKLFGGGNMFPEKYQHTGSQIGQKNVAAARRLIKKHGFKSIAEHMGDDGHRHIIFEVWSGEVWLRHIKSLTKQAAVKQPVTKAIEWHV